MAILASPFCTQAIMMVGCIKRIETYPRKYWINQTINQSINHAVACGERGRQPISYWYCTNLQTFSLGCIVRVASCHGRDVRRLKILGWCTSATTNDFAETSSMYARWHVWRLNLLSPSLRQLKKLKRKRKRFPTDSVASADWPMLLDGAVEEVYCSSTLWCNQYGSSNEMFDSILLGKCEWRNYSNFCFSKCPILLCRLTNNSTGIHSTEFVTWLYVENSEKCSE
jgi:hypothetical protein